MAGALVNVAMPRLSDSMEEATVVQWLKRPGDVVVKGEPLVEVETDKATVVYEAERDGVLTEILVDEGAAAALGAVIARLSVEGAAPAASPPDETPAAPPPVETEAQARAPRPAGARPRATPVARRVADELGVDLAQVNGSGPGGRIVESDVRASAQARAGGALRPPPGPRAGPVVSGKGEETAVELTATQRTIAERMAASRRDVPDFTLEVEVDMESAAALRDDLRELGREPLPSFNDLVVRAVALALREHAALNASYADGRVIRYERINVGIAVATDDALLAPAVFDADRKSLFEIAEASRDVIDRARRRAVSTDDLRAATFTVSNLGMFGIRRFQAVVNPPQAAILAVGALERRPVVADDGAIVARRRIDVALSCDHRVVYGADAARFLRRVQALLEHPVALVIT